MDVVPLMLRPDIEGYARLAKELVAGGEVDAAWLEAVGVPGDRFVQDSIDRAVARMRAERPSTLADAQRVLARAHGFGSWVAFADHVEGIAGNAFEAAADAVVAGAEETLGQLLRADPGLVRARSARRHRATLLHYVAANGVDALADTYGGGVAQTTLNLLVSSAHPAHAGHHMPGGTGHESLEVLRRLPA